MNHQMRRSQLWVYFLGACFLVTPFFNLAFSIKNLHDPNWYTLQTIFTYIPLLETLDLVWLIFVALSGVLILLRKKWSWTFALIILILTNAMNFYRLLQNDGTDISSHQFQSISIATNLGLIIVFYFFRFPYIDKRSGFIPNSDAPREKTEQSVQIYLENSSEPTAGLLKDISLTGAFIETTEVEQFKKDMVVKIEIADSTRSARIIRTTSDGVGIKFQS